MKIMKMHNAKYLIREGFHNLWTNRTHDAGVGRRADFVPVADGGGHAVFAEHGNRYEKIGRQQ